mgnify:CR=1 FL=1
MEIKVSVVMLTYGHEDYIIDAIAGVLSQKFEGMIELLISNDCSPDRTDKVVKNFLDNIILPTNIRINYVFHQTNKGILPNLLWCLENSRGKFVAICEGDDYWTDPNKLQKQINFLNNNSDCNLVYHRVNILRNNHNLELEDLNSSELEKKWTIHDLAFQGNLMHTPSVVFRNNLTIPKELFKGVVGDYPLWFLNAERGKLGYLPDVMAVYRMWDGSVWSYNKSLLIKIRTWVELLISMRKYSKDSTIKLALKQQALRAFKNFGFTGLSLKNKIIFFWLLLKVDKLYAFNLFFSKLFKVTIK